MGIDLTGYITKDYVEMTLPTRNSDAHKGDCGRVLIVAGGAGMTGAAIFSAKAALRAGAGLVYICTPKANFPVIQISIPEAICVEWEDAITAIDRGSGNNPNESGDARHSYDVIAFGPGMGTGLSTKKKLKDILLSYDGPLVIDADGLNQISEDEDIQELVKEYRGEIVITPHVVEAKRLLAAKNNLPETQPQSDEEKEEWRKEMILNMVDSYETIAILKGAGTLISRITPKDETSVEMWQNTTGNPGMATGGSGDVLTGVISAMKAQGLSLWDATRVAVFIHGFAGDIAAEEKGQHGLIASDIIEAVPYAIKSFFI